MSKTEKKYGIRGLVQEAFIIIRMIGGCAYSYRSVGHVICSSHSCLKRGQLFSPSIKRMQEYYMP